MSAIASHRSSSTDRRKSSIARYDSAAFFSYLPLGAVTQGSYALNNPLTASYMWATHNPSCYLTPSAPANPNAYSSTPLGPSYSSDYSSHRTLLSPSRSNPYSVSAPSPSLCSPSRSSYGASSRSYTPLADATVSPHHSPPTSNRIHHGHWDSNALYTNDSSDAMSPPPPSPDADSPPPIQEDDPEGGFVIEVSVPAEHPIISPMPEVPIRATHAPPKMRKMMYLEDAFVPQVPEGFRYGALPPPRPNSRSSYLYRAVSPASSRQSTKMGYSSTGSLSPPLSFEYSPTVESESWDASSEYGSVTDSTSTSTASNSGMAACSPTFAAPAHSLGWGLRGFGAGEVDAVESSSTYRRHGSVQSSCSSLRSAYRQPSWYRHDSATFFRGGSMNSHGPDMYASLTSSSSSWNRTSCPSRLNLGNTSPLSPAFLRGGFTGTHPNEDVSWLCVDISDRKKTPLGASCQHACTGC